MKEQEKQQGKAAKKYNAGIDLNNVKDKLAGALTEPSTPSNGAAQGSCAASNVGRELNKSVLSSKKASKDSATASVAVLAGGEGGADTPENKKKSLRKDRVCITWTRMVP